MALPATYALAPTLARQRNEMMLSPACMALTVLGTEQAGNTFERGCRRTNVPAGKLAA